MTLFFVDDEATIRQSMAQTMELAEIPCRVFSSADQLLSQLPTDFDGVVVSDISMPERDGLSLMGALHQTDPDLPVILLTGHGDISMAVEAMRGGAYDFIEKPFETELIVDVVRRALEKRSLTLENRNLKNQLAQQSRPGPRILGGSQKILHMLSVLNQVVDAPADVLLHGETGTGKDLIARWLHESSERHQHNFVAINCGAVPENLIESELFGHESGAFTGAEKKRIGKLEHANGGTLFLDEIESMPAGLQVKLLRVLEERKLERLGSNQQIDLNIRVIAATKEDLKTLSESGSFRSDLYYRLNIVKVDIPSLRDRTQDIPLLFQHFALVASARYQRELIPPAPSRMAALAHYDWPGNVRELRNLAERYVLMGDVAFDQLATPIDYEYSAIKTLSEMVDQFEATVISSALKECQGSIKDTMARLGLARKTLYDKMKKYGIDKKDFKE